MFVVVLFGRCVCASSPAKETPAARGIGVCAEFNAAIIGNAGLRWHCCARDVVIILVVGNRIGVCFIGRSNFDCCSQSDCTRIIRRTVTPAHEVISFVRLCANGDFAAVIICAICDSSGRIAVFGAAECKLEFFALIVILDNR